MLILHHVHDNFNSCLNVTYLFLVFPHPLIDLWREQSSVSTIVAKSIIPNYIIEVRCKISFGFWFGLDLPIFVSLWVCLHTFSLAVDFDGFGLLLMTWEFSTNPVHLFSFVMGFASSPIFIFGLAIMVLTFLSSYLYTNTYCTIQIDVTSCPWCEETVASCSHPATLNAGHGKTK